MTSWRAVALATATAWSMGCAGAASITDAEKLERVEEMISEVAERFPDVEHVTVETVVRLLDKDSVVLVDVREPRERAVSMIAGAIPVEEFERDPARFADVAVVAYCTIGHRSSEYARRLARSGHRVLNLSGSILAWTHAGAPLVSNGQPSLRVHVYGPEWDLAPERFETVR